MAGWFQEAVRFAEAENAEAEFVGNDQLNNITIGFIIFKDQNSRAFISVKKFHHFKRSSGWFLLILWLKFKLLYMLVKYEMALPEAMKRYFLFNAANMRPEEIWLEQDVECCVISIWKIE